ncbi:hypothetical protein SAPIO_CDS2855 [Scedosporium apiospermum]|uniref:Actin-related protein 2/3 complex subunit 5 n=1 Tax=Pseudallescheria apiosperma TaxID=563466 RepID=A0A084GBP5_PSEDA|nr:uncharacterized protein SAPIO_CDS2855 [Scedosporium apiospermum]KEZ44757.1 hypothetical protein SAPIO_CDS2855 [Scedosporium apiospermum]
MSIIQQHSEATLGDAWRTINIDALEEDSPLNFDTSTLSPPQPEISESDVRGLAQQDAHLQTITEVLQSIKASEMTPLLNRIYGSEGGSELLDVLVKYLYKGMAAGSAGPGPRSPTRIIPQATGGFSQVGSRPGAANESVTAAMSVLLSWHEKAVEVAGLGSIVRCMTDFRRV